MWSVAPERSRNRSYSLFPTNIEDAGRSGFGDSGTLVVWSDLDRVEWKQAATTFKHTETLLGRIYRRFLAKSSERLHADRFES